MAWLQATTQRITGWLTAQRGEAVALPCYDNLVAQARRPVFYGDAYRVPDSPQGRFELVLLHAALVMRCLSNEPAFSQNLFDLMFAEFDIGLRELGVGDLGVGKRVHGWAAAFRGRAAVYAAALGNNKLTDADALAAALSRNVYASRPAPDGGARLARYVIAADAQLAAQAPETIMNGALQWPQPETIA